jgi:regulatory protein YycH of two-component signal transduction system YycFG
MKAKWIEPAKTATLLLLVTISFVLTGYLWFSSPAYEEKSLNGYVPPYLFSDQYNKRDVFRLTAPHQIILHRGGKAAWLLPEDPSYDKLIRLVREADLVNDTEIKPTPNDWKNLFLQATGIELLFSEDVSISYLDAFFKESLWQKPFLNRMTDISRIWVFTDPASGQSRIWFISDARQKIVQLDFQPKDGNLNSELASIPASSSPELVPIPLGGKAPWDPAAASGPFARIAWLPVAPVPMEELQFEIGQIKIKDMIEWLFKNPEIEPINVSGENFYMYNDQLLRYHPKSEFMVYSDLSSKSEPGSFTMRDELLNLNNFVQRHRGWSGNFLLDRVNKTDDGYQYIFRLFYKGIPVYWKNAKTIGTANQPDQIELEAGQNGASEYSRSMLYLSGNPKHVPSNPLPEKDKLLQLLSSKGISTDKVERIFPGYEASYTRSTTRSTREAVLKPAWVIVVHNQPPILLSTSP